MTPALITAIAQLLGIAVPTIAQVIMTLKTNDGRSVDVIIQDNKGIGQAILDAAAAWEAAHPQQPK